jgi:hypothetical protein
MNDAYKICKKDKEGKWKTFGSVKKNQFGNYSLGIKNTQEFKDLVGSSAEWLNFSLFVEKEKPDYKPAVNQSGQVVDELNDEVPF